MQRQSIASPLPILTNEQGVKISLLSQSSDGGSVVDERQSFCGFYLKQAHQRALFVIQT